MGGVVSVACQGFLVREACVGVLVGGDGRIYTGIKIGKSDFTVSVCCKLVKVSNIHTFNFKGCSIKLITRVSINLLDADAGLCGVEECKCCSFVTLYIRE